MDGRPFARGARIAYRATDPTGATLERGTVVATRPGSSPTVRVRRDGEGRDLWYTTPDRTSSPLAEEASPATTGPAGTW